MLASRFKGCLLGALAGDCLGAPFEGIGYGGFGSREAAAEFSKRVVDDVTRKSSYGLTTNSVSSKHWSYTDDSAMTRDICKSLISCRSFNAFDMARRFQETFFSEPFRGYGASIGVVFVKMVELGEGDDPYVPATEQFNGSGSYGNGGAMRAAPIALFHPTDLTASLQLAADQCRLTHTHPDALMGAVLQTAAVHLALHSDPDDFHSAKFLEQLITISNSQAKSIYGTKENPYEKKLAGFQELLEKAVEPYDVGLSLGNEISALKSVPAAIFSFLRGLDPRNFVETENPLLRSLMFSISVGGDTDTIGTMTGAIAGAFFGDQRLPGVWMQRLEAADEVSQAAQHLYSMRVCHRVTVDFCRFL